MRHRTAQMLLDEVFLAVDQRSAFLILGMMHVRAIGLHVPADRRIGHLHVDVLDEFVDLFRRGDADQRLDTTVEVAVHQIGGTDPHFGAGQRAFADLRAVGVAERVDAAVLQETAENRTDADVVAQPGNLGLERADATFDDIDLHAGLACAVQSVDGLLVHHRIDLDLDPRLLAGACGLLLAANALDQAGADGARCDQQTMEA